MELEDDERFAAFEIRLGKVLAKVVNSGRSEEDIVQDLIANNARDARLR